MVKEVFIITSDIYYLRFDRDSTYQFKVHHTTTKEVATRFDDETQAKDTLSKSDYTGLVEIKKFYVKTSAPIKTPKIPQL